MITNGTRASYQVYLRANLLGGGVISTTLAKLVRLDLFSGKGAMKKVSDSFSKKCNFCRKNIFFDIFGNFVHGNAI